MAGTNPDFPTSEFRAQIRSIMVAAEAQDPADRVIFHWNAQRTFTHADSTGVPYDLAATANSTAQHPPVTIPVALEYAGGGTEEGSAGFGPIDTSKAVLTILDVDWPSVDGADYLTIAGDAYDIDSAVPVALYDFQVYTMHVHSRTRA